MCKTDVHNLLRTLNLMNKKYWIICISVICIADIRIHSLNIKILVDEIIQNIVSAFFPKKCFPEFGCFSNGPPFFSLFYRPFNYLPQDNLNITYLLYTPSRSNRSYNISLGDHSVTRSPFDANLPTKVIIPGFNVTLKLDGEIFHMKDEFLKEGSCNVIIVDWTGANNYPYPQAIANGRKVGASTAMLLNHLKERKGLEYADVHVIGHSLGAHVAGWVGERINKIGRITGLDPAGPYFYNSPRRVRLDETDAIFVDVIHTNAATNLFRGFGIHEPIGDIDFYPNGVTNQPQCQRNYSLSYLERLICEHSSASKYFIASINTCKYFSVHCKDYKKYLKGHCTYYNSIVDEMGFHAKRITYLPRHSKFYVNTTERSPFCATNEKEGAGPQNY